MDFERKLATEDTDIAQIVQGILTVQARYAAEQHRPLGRGTHTKGVCVRGVFEIFDLAKTIGDPALSARLARGIFARPGTYPATVRFANAASTFQPDSDHDVRALSFFIDVPGGVVGPNATRLDFSMNNAPTFPINDAHAFATFLRVDTAATGLEKLKALFSQSFADRRGIYATAVRGIRQQRTPVKPYQQQRYWSNVPFLHGADQAVKYSAIPRATNPAHPIGKGDNVLRDELIRHVNDDSEMSAFDFALQLLDAARMTHKGARQEPSYWIENASVEWLESEAPFHSVGRLSLLPKSALADAACASMYIDVTEHALPDHRPLGSINRARWAAESASRRLRQTPASGAPAATPAASAPGVFGRLADMRVITAVKWGARLLALIPLSVLLFAVATVVATHAGCGMLPAERIDTLAYLDQGWGPDANAPDRQTYYYTPQGAGLKDLRYRWFVNLEMPLSTRRLADPAVMRRYGFAVDQQPSAMNPDHLPVGFSRHFDRGVNEELLDITCAACHTGQINVVRNGSTTALRIDGGSALHAFTDSNLGHFVPTLMSSMLATAANPLKFRRFAYNVLGEEHYDEGYWTLHRGLLGVVWKLLKMGYHEKTRDLTPTEEGYGRTDALARIANTVFGDNIDDRNYRQGSAPVNYPPVWNIWKFDWVQYNASVSQPMARNIGEAMGTGAKYTLVDPYGRPLPPEERFRSTAMLENLHTIELTLRKLQPPMWNEAILGPVDRARAERGKQLFQQHCEGCHGPHIAPPAIKARNAPLKTDADPEWLMRTLCVDDIGTDPTTAVNFARRPGMNITRTGLTAEDLKRVARLNLEPWRQRQIAYLTSEIARLESEPAATDTAGQLAAYEQELYEANDPAGYMEKQLAGINPADLTVGAGLSYLGVMIREKAYADNHYTPEQRADRDGFGILDLPQVIVGYKPRPLAGIWAAPPFLHNGSVPTIYDLLSPVAERPRTFRVGSRQYDTEKLGLAAITSGYWVFDTSKEGNYNRGHEFNTGYNADVEGPQGGLIGPLLSHDDRLAIIEHLKIRNDDLDGPKTPRIPPQCPPAP